MERQTDGTTATATPETTGTTGTTGPAGQRGGRVGQELGPAAQRLSAAISNLDRRYGWSQTVKDNPWPALAVAAGIGFALAETGLDRGAKAATSQATTGIKSSAATLVETLATAATATVTQAVYGHLNTLVDELKRAIGAPSPPR